MIGIINLEQIVVDCLECLGSKEKTIRLMPCIAGDFFYHYKLRSNLPRIKNQQRAKIDLNLVSQLLYAFVENPVLDIRDIDVSSNPSIAIQKDQSSNYMHLFSLFSINDIDQESVTNLGSLDQLAERIKVAYKKALASFIMDKDVVEIVSNNLGIGIDYISDQKRIHMTISSQTIPYFFTKSEGSDLLLQYPEFELDTMGETELQKQYRFLKAHLISHSIIINLLIKSILDDLDERDGFYFCLGKDGSSEFKEQVQALINYKDNNLFLIQIDPIDKHLPNLDEYKIRELIGQGAYKRVYTASHVQLNDSVAIKIIDIVLLALQPNIQRAIKTKMVSGSNLSLENAVIAIFQEEAQLMIKATKARSNNISQIYRAYYDAKTKNYIIIEELGDETLADVLKRENNLDPSTVSNYLLQIVDGIEQLHALGFVHGDLKPENILVNKDGSVRITDFGWSSQIPLLSEHYDDPRYLTNLLTCAPEVFDGKHPDKKSDIWSLGVIACRMLTGEWPFQHGFTGSQEEWKALSPEKKQEYAQKIGDEIRHKSRLDDLFGSKRIQDVLYGNPERYMDDQVEYYRLIEHLKVFIRNAMDYKSSSRLLKRNSLDY